MVQAIRDQYVIIVAAIVLVALVIALWRIRRGK
jgi:cobalamin biosynthesis Mg chelatase CobN